MFSQYRSLMGGSKSGEREREIEVPWKIANMSYGCIHFISIIYSCYIFSNIFVLKVVCIFCNKSYFVSNSISIIHTLHATKHEITLGYFWPCQLRTCNCLPVYFPFFSSLCITILSLLLKNNNVREKTNTVWSHFYSESKKTQMHRKREQFDGVRGGE